MLIFVISKHSNDLHIPHEQVFKDEIEKADQPGGPILDPPESKSIFGGDWWLAMTIIRSCLMDNFQEECLYVMDQ